MRNQEIRLNDVSFATQNREILNHVSLTLSAGQRIALMGPSGIGKTTLLRLLAGLCQPTSGSICMDPSLRISMVFDGDSLYPMLTCRQNIELGIPWTHRNSKERKELASRWGEVFDCPAFMEQKASTLSNGQRKRCGLARAMMKNPDLLLLDETFHALDPALRAEMAARLLDLQRQRSFAIVLATHSQQDAELLEAEVLRIE